MVVKTVRCGRKSGLAPIFAYSVVCSGSMKSVNIFSSLAACLVLTLMGSVVVGQNRPAAPSSPRLYILDCGTIGSMNPVNYDLKAEEIKGSLDFVTPCYLVVHPRGTLMWDIGQIPDANFPADGGTAKQGVFTSTRKLLPQLTALGYKAADITYVAMSHYHTDHTDQRQRICRFDMDRTEGRT